jgi:chromosome segregation ATPase
VELVVPAADEPSTPEAAASAEPEPAASPEHEREPEIEPSIVADAAVAVARASTERHADTVAAEHVEANREDDPRARKLVDAWAESASLREKLADREAELAKALKDLLEARQNVVPLREYAEDLTVELASIRKQLARARRDGRSESEVAAELAAVRAQLADVEPGLAEAELERKAAEREAVAARDEVMRLERELTEARLAVESAIRDAKAQLEDARREAAAAQDRLSAEAEEQQKTAEELRTELTKLENGKSRRRGVARRAEDRELQKVRAELEAQLAAREERIGQLEQEAASFAKRRDDALTESLRTRVGELEDEVLQHTTCNEDLRALLESERELVSTARKEAQELKRQLAAAKASRVTEPAEPAVVTALAPAREPGAAREPIESPPWSALDDELLARIEKAKALAG